MSDKLGVTSKESLGTSLMTTTSLAAPPRRLALSASFSLRNKQDITQKWEVSYQNQTTFLVSDLFKACVLLRIYGSHSVNTCTYMYVFRYVNLQRNLIN